MSRDFLGGRKRVHLQVRLSPNRQPRVSRKTPAKRKTRRKAAGADTLASTNVSSPAQIIPKANLSSRKGKQAARTSPTNIDSDAEFVVNDDHEPTTCDDSDPAFDDVPHTMRSKAASKSRLGPAITVDEKLNDLNEIHRMVVEQFVDFAKDKRKQVKTCYFALFNFN